MKKVKWFAPVVFALCFTLLSACEGKGGGAEADVNDGESVVPTGETRADGWRCEGCWDSASETIQISIYDPAAPDAPAQWFTIEAPGSFGASGECHWEDVNFDGFEDVLALKGGGRGGSLFYAALLYEPSTGQYREEATYADIPHPIPDPEHWIVWGGYDVAYGMAVSAWEVCDGTYIETHRLSARPDGDGGEIRCQEYVHAGDGEIMELAGERVFPKEGPTWDLEAYVAAGALWEGWKWCEFGHFYQLG